MRRRPADGELRPLLRRHLPMVHWTTVESGALAPGTPDCEGCHRGQAFWIECKWTAGWRVTLRPEQVGWHLRRSRAGGTSFVLTRRTGADGSDDLWLHPGAAAAELRHGGLMAVTPLLLTAGGPSSWNWTRLLTVLTAGAARS